MYQIQLAKLKDGQWNNQVEAELIKKEREKLQNEIREKELAGDAEPQSNAEKAYLDQEIEQSEIQPAQKVLSLDIGGTHKIKTNQDLLCLVDGSKLQKMFSGKYKLVTNEEGNIFLDRNGSTFICLVNYLRNNREEIP